LDENLSDRIISRVADFFPDSTHIKAVGLKEADEFVVWEWAKKHGFAIVSKDTDFHEWIGNTNTPTSRVGEGESRGSTTEPLRPIAMRAFRIGVDSA